MWVKQTDLIFPLICNSNWEFSGTETTHTQAKWGSRPLLQLCPLILMTLNDLNIRPHHNLAKWCLFSAMAGPIGSMGHGPMGWALYPGCDPGVMMMYSLTFLSMLLIQRQRRKQDWMFSDMILWSMFGNWHWSFTYWLSDVIFGADVKDQSCCQETYMFIWFTVWWTLCCKTRRKRWTVKGFNEL